jgi:lipopolysaccharide biosynthesis glycosyltransferase
MRVFMPRLWQPDYDRLFYLDGDIYYQRGDISALLSQPMGGLALAAVPDCHFWERPDHHTNDLKALGLPAARYFNAGVLLIDVPTFITQGFSDAVLQLIVTRGKELLARDQTALNVVMANRWAQLPLQWNYQYEYKTALWASQVDVCLFHFVGRRKPFYALYGAYARRFTTPYRLFMGQYFPHLVAQINDGLGGPKRWGMLLLVVLFNLKKMRGILMLEAQTDGDFDIRPIAPSAD